MQLKHLLFLALIIFMVNSRIVKVLNIFIPSYPESTYPPTSEQSKVGISPSAISEEFNFGKQLRYSYGDNLSLSTLNTSQILYVVPGDAQTVISGLSQFFGLASPALSLSEDQARNLLSDAEKLGKKVKKIQNEDFQTIEFDDLPALRDSFRILPSSLLLESSDYECPSKEAFFNTKRNTIPKEVQTVYKSLKKELDGQAKNLDELFELYQQVLLHRLNKNVLPEGISEKTFKDLEYLASVYALYAYYEDKTVAKINAGSLIKRLFYEMYNEGGHRIVSFGVHQAAFVSLLRAFDILSYNNTITDFKNSSEEVIQSLVYPHPGSNLIIEVHLDDDNNLIVAAKYKGLDQRICGKSSSHCYLTKINKKYKEFVVNNIEAFKSLCTSEINKSDGNQGKGFKFTDIFYYLGVVLVVYSAYKLLLFVYRVLKMFYDVKRYKKHKKDEHGRVSSPTGTNENGTTKSVELNETKDADEWALKEDNYV